MLKWLLIIFSFVLVGCNLEAPLNFYLDSVQPSEARQNQDNSRYWVYPEENIIRVEELNDSMNFEFEEYKLDDYELNENSVVLEYNNEIVSFEKLSDSVYVSETNTWYNFDLKEENGEVVAAEEAEGTTAVRGSVTNPYKVGETATTRIRYLDDQLDSFYGVINLTLNNYRIGQEAEGFVLSQDEYNQSASPIEGLQWLVADVTVSLIEGSDQNPYKIYLPFQVYDDQAFIAQYGETLAVLKDNIEGKVIYPNQTAKGKMAILVPEEDLSNVLIEIKTEQNPIWFEF